MQLKIIEVCYHRNGSAGDGFHVVTFKQGRGRDAVNMVATVGSDRRDVRVINADQAAAGHATDRFDGPAYEDDLRAAVLAYARNQFDGRISDEEVRDILYGKHECMGSGGVMCLPRDQCVVCKQKVEVNES